MSEQWTLFNSDGSVNAQLICPESMAKQNAGLGFTVMAGSYDADQHYLDAASGAVKERPELNITVEPDTQPINGLFRFSGIPEQTTVIHPAGELIVDDGFIEWSCAEAGTYPFRFKCFPHKEVTINAIVTEA